MGQHLFSSVLKQLNSNLAIALCIEKGKGKVVI